MSLYTISKTEELPVIGKPKGLTIVESADTTLLSALANLPEEAISKWFEKDHLAFVA